MTREVHILPAYDKRPKYGIHGVEMRFYVKGPEGAVQFVLYTGWMLPHVAEEQKHMGRGPDYPMAADLGYHSPTPKYEGQTLMQENCPMINGPCYYDGSGLNAQGVMDTLIAEGDEAMWRAIEGYYRRTFLEETA